MGYAAEIECFKKRKFSGMDLLMIMDYSGVGTGATLHLVKEIEKTTEYK